MGQQKAYEIIRLVRRLFRAMGARTNEYLKDWDLAAADRAVMEFLYPDAMLSVPEIAGRYKVSRQHVQVTVNKLLERGLLRGEENPRHKRSSLIRLSGRGRACFAEIRQTEATLLNQLFADIGDADLDTTQRTLRSLSEKLS